MKWNPILEGLYTYLPLLYFLFRTSNISSNFTVYMKYYSWEWLFTVLVKTYVVYIHKSREPKIVSEKVILFKISKYKLGTQRVCTKGEICDSKKLTIIYQSRQSRCLNW